MWLVRLPGVWAFAIHSCSTDAEPGAGAGESSCVEELKHLRAGATWCAENLNESKAYGLPFKFRVPSENHVQTRLHVFDVVLLHALGAGATWCVCRLEDLLVVTFRHKPGAGSPCWFERVGVTETYFGLPLAGKTW